MAIKAQQPTAIAIEHLLAISFIFIAPLASFCVSRRLSRNQPQVAFVLRNSELVMNGAAKLWGYLGL
jgi:hypothetical protein